MSTTGTQFWLTRAKSKRAWKIWEGSELDICTHFRSGVEQVLRGPFESTREARGFVSPAPVEFGQVVDPQAAEAPPEASGGAQGGTTTEPEA